jgi:hypothetical protein
MENKDSLKDMSILIFRPGLKMCSNFETIHGFMSISCHNNQERVKIGRLLHRIGPGKRKPMPTASGYAVVFGGGMPD